MRISDWSSDVCSSDLGIGIGKRLARAVDMEEAQRDGRNAIGLSNQKAHSLLRVLAERIDGTQRRALALRRRNGFERVVGGIAELPLPGAQLCRRTLRHFHRLARRIAVQDRKSTRLNSSH